MSLPHFHFKKIRWTREGSITAHNTIVIYDKCVHCDYKVKVATAECQNDPGWVIVW